MSEQEIATIMDFFDVDGFTEIAMTVLDDPEKHRHLGQAGAKLIQDGFSLDKMLPKMLNLYEQTIATAS